MLERRSIIRNPHSTNGDGHEVEPVLVEDEQVVVRSGYHRWEILRPLGLLLRIEPVVTDGAVDHLNTVEDT